ncbi:uncharacterized protein LOC142341338 [Convolutriloba macropyga]|uniref:uncharacterized protein LOC142341338 n=1 Tax=Convolutriloba macropyga TaxID=536237 RepID=UPI003F51AD7C
MISDESTDSGKDSRDHAAKPSGLETTLSSDYPVRGSVRGSDQTFQTVGSAVWTLDWSQNRQNSVAAQTLCKSPSGPHNVIRVNNEFVACTLSIEHPNAFPTDLDPYTTIDQWTTTNANAQQEMVQRSYSVYEFTVGDPENFTQWEYKPSGKSLVHETSEQYRHNAPSEFQNTEANMGRPNTLRADFMSTGQDSFPNRGGLADILARRTPTQNARQDMSFSGDSAAIRSRGSSPSGQFLLASSSSGSGGARAGLQAANTNNWNEVDRPPTPSGRRGSPSAKRALFLSADSSSSRGVCEIPADFPPQQMQQQQRQPMAAGVAMGGLRFSSASGDSDHYGPEAATSGGAPVNQRVQRPASTAALGGLGLSSGSSAGGGGFMGQSRAVPGHLASLMVGSGQPASNEPSRPSVGVDAYSDDLNQRIDPDMLSSLSSTEGSHYTSDQGAMGGVGRGSAASMQQQQHFSTAPSAKGLNFSSSESSQAAGVSSSVAPQQAAPEIPLVQLVPI